MCSPTYKPTSMNYWFTALLYVGFIDPRLWSTERVNACIENFETEFRNVVETLICSECFSLCFGLRIHCSHSK